MTPVPKKQRVRMIIDEHTISTQDVYDIIAPVRYTANIFGSYAEYEASLARFSHAQRIVLAICWYEVEVNNGGHYQFYWNSTGIVWEDATNGYSEIGLPQAAFIVAESAKRMGGRPSFNREERQKFMERKNPKFDDLDDQFYKLETGAKLIEYVRSRPKDFLFDGEIEK